ncbi:MULTISPECIES: DmsE family decaheme c-type cytochrome [Comamonadaceae]|jgi:DmsE family decaheme c-type cytochrome|uniref:DmsE family decaheme c-type cytochrome n=1 Tax=Comamonadaceae TaxID=80864 RepID=UPI0027343C10|nr:MULTISPECIES: DmsE family decaheme c-type cytochrome [Comamonadaceae]MDP3191337.1 DmsE family decaheme c-type cytochrome [Rhodoferax sp.]MDP3338447.1 DmsE family decaheme c-type cytochrome [Rhodoferax sp.]MDP3886520.1 DmsE family decaheme c-type cytochrome [Hydrogenophaga sp.]
MKNISGFKQFLKVTLRCAILGAVLAGGGVMAADASKAAAPKDLFLKGDAKCTICHDEGDGPELLAIGKTRHGMTGDSRTPTCTSCHGNSDKHVDYKGPDKPPAPDVSFGKKTKASAQARSASCLSCHTGGKNMHWDGGAHAANDVTCATCHSVHKAKDKVRDKTQQAEVCYACHKQQRADANKLSHHPMNEGKVTCSSCHNPHGSTGPKQLAKNNVNETCYTCHTEKRGPFLWEHPPASDDCSSCHTPHGSNQPAMLKARAPFLCASCHQTAGGGHPNTIRSGAGLGSPPGVGAQAQVVYKACLNCHTQVHGSNHPSGPRFVR